MDAQEILEKAADRVEAGWCQGECVNADGDVCAVGALHAVVDSAGNPQYAVAWGALCDEIDSAISVWNDAPGRTRYDVSDAMRRAAKTLANEAPSSGMSHVATTGEGKSPATHQSGGRYGAEESGRGSVDAPPPSDPYRHRKDHLMRSWATTSVRHGTHSGWTLHTQLKERPCDPCYRAKQAYDHRRKSAGLAQLRARKKARAQAIATRQLRRKYPGVWRQLYAEAVAEVLAEEANAS